HRFRQYRSQTNHLTSLYQSCPSLASIRHCSSRKLPRNRPGPTVFPKICGSSFSFVSQPNRSSKKCIGSTTGPLLTSTLQSQVKFWDWSKYRGDSAEFSAEV
ncbi:hypothetical protein Prudu_251S000200, partial [Prunus dulcis]